MSSRRIGLCAAAAMALGAGGLTAQTAAAATKIWLNRGGAVHGKPGEAVHVVASVEGCSFEQQGSLLTNGKARDKIAGGTAFPATCPSAGEKLAGSFTTLTAGPSEPEFPPPNFTISMGDKLRLEVEPWCTYRLPSKIVGQPSPLSLTQGTVQATLDKGASFGTCPATREVVFALDALDEGFSLYEAEFTG